MKSVSLLTCTLVALLSNCVELASGRRGFESRRSLGSGFLSAISLCFFLHVFKLHLSINMLIMHTMNIKKMAVLFSNLRYSLEALILLQKKNCVIRSLNLIEDYKLISLIETLSFFFHPGHYLNDLAAVLLLYKLVTIQTKQFSIVSQK